MCPCTMQPLMGSTHTHAPMYPCATPLSPTPLLGNALQAVSLAKRVGSHMDVEG